MKILIVDGSMIVREYIKDLLVGELGLGESDIAFADSGTAALGIIERARFDIVITDYRMEGMNGINLICNVREICFENVEYWILVSSSVGDLKSLTLVVKGEISLVSKRMLKAEISPIIGEIKAKMA